MKAVELFYNNSMITTPPATTDDWLANAKQARLGLRRQRRRGLLPVGPLQLLRRHDHGRRPPASAPPTSGGVADALKWLADMKAAGMNFYQNDGDAKADLISGKIAGFIDGPWQSADLTQGPRRQARPSSPGRPAPAATGPR